MKTDKQITIDNLRELADHGDAWPVERFGMEYYALIQSGGVSTPRRTDELNECSTTCCLVGIAAAHDMSGSPLIRGKSRGWNDYSRWVFPLISDHEWDDLFGEDLPNIMPERTQALRDYADKLEAGL